MPSPIIANHANSIQVLFFNSLEKGKVTKSNLQKCLKSIRNDPDRLNNKNTFHYLNRINGILDNQNSKALDIKKRLLCSIFVATLPGKVNSKQSLPAKMRTAETAAPQSKESTTPIAKANNQPELKELLAKSHQMLTELEKRIKINNDLTKKQYVLRSGGETHNLQPTKEKISPLTETEKKLKNIPEKFDILKKRI